jgi:RNA polymerase sigma-70 factor (ECF subfamily)
MQTEPSDPDLMASIADGDREAFAALFRRRQADVYRFALHMTASPSIADDVTQEVFLTVMRDVGRYDARRATVIAWLCGIARNHVLRRLERDRMLQPLEDDENDDEGLSDMTRVDDSSLLDDLTKTETIEALHRAVLSLPVKYREAIVLCELQELSYNDAAGALGCAVGTVRSRLHRGRALLAKKLKAVEGERTASSVESGFRRTHEERRQPFPPVRRSLA